MTNKLEIDLELAERLERALNQVGVQDHLCDYTLVSDVKKELSALHAQAEMWNPHPAEAHLASLLIALGSAGIKVSGGTHGDPWTVAAPVVERQDPVEGLTRYRTLASGRMTACDQGFYVRYSDVKKLYAEQPAPVAVVERQYYYRMDACKVNDSADPDCKCWHDEGTGPLFNKFSTIEPKSWRPKP